MGYDELIHEALTTPFEGWDFGVLRGRVTDDGTLPWDYEQLVRDRLPKASALLDLGTGGGELLASLAPLPPRTVATEGHAPNIPVARRRLEPLGVEVTETTGMFPDGSFDLIINRHEAYDPSEIHRLLADGGTFVTQQVSGRDLEEINETLGAPPHRNRGWDLAAATAGLDVTWSQEARFTTTFHDIGALVLFLRVIPWQIPDFDATGYDARLRVLHEAMERGHPLKATAHRFAVLAH
ncbi:methyltransferase family protein [Nonomuraea polychroma]|uniref:Methyltransferase family protein n=1 Tax=Nonomuraea polychroma TaxID=46176 RepID=A0A438LYA0_9ACTN|nr:class I SAM-dependent methyltransferase [Nonomuraea polychroma]RVX38525.1 methyltransferase family protein [Nonomuraea polychroma]